MNALILSILMSINDVKFLGMHLIDTEDLLELVIRFIFNFAIIGIIIRLIYYRQRQKKDFLFSFFSIALVVFLICYLLESVKLELGFALGLFAIFGIIRYRTRQIPIREMTYLFVVIGISVINALANKKISYAELLFTNIALVFVIYFLEKVNYNKAINTKKLILHETVDSIDLSDDESIKETLQERTGLEIVRFNVGKIDYAGNSVEITIFFKVD